MQTEEKFQEGVMRALWERLNQQRWMKSSNDDREYILQAFQGDVEMPDQSEGEDEDYNLDDSHGSSHSVRWTYYEAIGYDKDEDYNVPEQPTYAGAKNSALAVGYKSDRSFVVRGDKIGVFKHTEDDNLGISLFIRPTIL
jgi:hypothetical protein